VRLGELPDVRWTPSSSDEVPERAHELPEELVDLLTPVDGLIALGGAIHFRGARSALTWHDLFAFSTGKHALSRLYRSVSTADVPFAANCLGDQFLLRRGAVLQLIAETGELEDVAPSLGAFLDRLARQDPDIWLGARFLRQFESQGTLLAPDRVLLPYPPLVSTESRAGVRLGAIPACEAVEYYAEFARTIEDLPDGASVKIVVKK
jgi:hypothetical protein